jgi:hypothetical protein
MPKEQKGTYFPSEGITKHKNKKHLDLFLTFSHDTWQVSNKYPLGITGKKLKDNAEHFGKWCEHFVFGNASQYFTLCKITSKCTKKNLGGFHDWVIFRALVSSNSIWGKTL